MSIYASWEKSHGIGKSNFIFADASVHRLVSDLSVFAGKKFGLDLLVAGDLNILHGYGEHGDAYWSGRYETVFTRITALGLKFVGPQAPNGRRAEPWPAELPRTSNNRSYLPHEAADAGDLHTAAGFRVCIESTS